MPPVRLCTGRSVMRVPLLSRPFFCSECWSATVCDNWLPTIEALELSSASLSEYSKLVLARRGWASAFPSRSTFSVSALNGWPLTRN